MLLRLQLGLGLVICLLICALGDNQAACKRKCRTLTTEEKWYFADGGVTFCYSYDQEFGDDMYSNDPTGGARTPQLKMIFRKTWSKCDQICDPATAGPQIMKNGTEGNEFEVPQVKCIATP